MIKSYSHSGISPTLAFWRYVVCLGHKATALTRPTGHERQLVGAISDGATRNISAELLIKVPILGRIEIA